MLIRIGSSDNSRIRLVRKLQTRKGRSTERRFVAEGINLVSEALRRDLDIDFVMVSDAYDGGQMLEDMKASDRLTVCEVPSAMFDRLTDAENGVGIIAVIHTLQCDASVIDDLPEDANVLVLDRIQDPGNLGTMIRTAVAAGYGMIIAVRGTADIWSAKVLRSTAGTIFDIPFVYVSGAEELCTILRKAGKRITVTDPAGGRPYFEEDLKHGIALVIGNESNGISDEVMSIADLRVTLPMHGEVESLNAAVSAAILMYESVRS